MGIFDNTGVFGDQQPLANSANPSPLSPSTFYESNPMQNNVLPGQGVTQNILASGQTGATPPTTSTNMQGIFGNIGQGLGAFSTLASIYGMFKNLGFQKKAFKFAQEGTKRNFNANAIAHNANVEDDANARSSSASYYGRPDFDKGVFKEGRTIEKWAA